MHLMQVVLVKCVLVVVVLMHYLLVVVVVVYYLFRLVRLVVEMFHTMCRDDLVLVVVVLLVSYRALGVGCVAV